MIRAGRRGPDPPELGRGSPGNGRNWAGAGGEDSGLSEGRWRVAKAFIVHREMTLLPLIMVASYRQLVVGTSLSVLGVVW